MLILAKPVQVRSLVPDTGKVLNLVESSRILFTLIHTLPFLSIICKVLFSPLCLVFGNLWSLSLSGSSLLSCYCLWWFALFVWPLVTSVYGFCPFGVPELRMSQS